MGANTPRQATESRAKGSRRAKGSVDPQLVDGIPLRHHMREGAADTRFSLDDGRWPIASATVNSRVAADESRREAGHPARNNKADRVGQTQGIARLAERLPSQAAEHGWDRRVPPPAHFHNKRVETAARQARGILHLELVVVAPRRSVPWRAGAFRDKSAGFPQSGNDRDVVRSGTPESTSKLDDVQTSRRPHGRVALLELNKAASR